MNNLIKTAIRLTLCVTLMSWGITTVAKKIPHTPQTTTPTHKKTHIKIEQWTTTNGTPVYFVQRKELPIIDLSIAFSAGSAYDEKKYGLSSLTNDLLYSGTTTKTIDDIAKGFADVGAIYQSSVTRDMSVITLRTLSAPTHRTPALNLLSDIISHPSFPEKEFTRIKNMALRSLEHQEQSPGVIASRQFFKALYKEQPYAHPIIGSMESVQTLDLKAVKHFYTTHYVSHNAIITLVGPLSVQDAKQLTHNLVKNLPTGNAAPPISSAPPLVTSVKKQITFPSSQTHVIIGALGIKKNDPDYLVLKVGNGVLGGIPSASLLFDKVRTQHGLAYTVYSALQSMQKRGPFFIKLQTRNNKTEEAITLTHQVLSQFLTNGPDKKEVSLAKQVLIGQFPFGIASNSALNSILLNIGYYHFPLDYLNTYRDKISTITADDIKQAFQKQFKDQQLITVIVGNHHRATT